MKNNISQALVKMYVAIISHSYFSTVFTCPLTASRDSNLQPHLASPRSRQIDAWILSDQELSPLSRLFASMPFCFVFPGSAAAVAAVTERERGRERGECGERAAPSVGRVSASPLLKPIPTQRPHFLLNLKREAALTMW